MAILKFLWIGVQLVGPMKMSAARYKYTLVILDCTTRDPGAIPLWSEMAVVVASKLIKVFA